MSTPASPSTATHLPFERLLLTGAAGTLGRILRPRLKALCRTLRVSDIAALDEAAAGEELRPARLEDRAAMLALLQDVDAVVHLGGVSYERAFDEVLPANIVGVYNLYEAARRQGVRRVVFASSNHVTGYYRQDEVIGPEVPHRPDGYYGVSKAFGENLASFYFDRYGIETVSLRIGSVQPEPLDRRMLATWLSADDLERLVRSALTAPIVGHCVVFGMSDNKTSWWDNRNARLIGYAPQHSSEPYRAAVEARQPRVDVTAPTAIHQGGVFVTLGPFD